MRLRAIFSKGRSQDKHAILDSVYFGHGTAERDNMLSATFVETPLFRDVFKGRIDLVLGAKGSGKSAICSLLQVRTDQLRKQRVLIVSAENAHGEPVFQGLSAIPGLDDERLVHLWKLYFLTLAGQALRSANLTRTREARALLQYLEGASLLPKDPADFSLADTLRAVLRYVHPELSIPLPLPVPPVVRVPELHISVQEPPSGDAPHGAESVPGLFRLVGSVLTRAKLTLWITVDRLDVAFANDDALESRVLIALLRAAADLRTPTYHTAVKMFMRSDIWDRVTGKNTRVGRKIPEATSFEGREITWSEPTLLDLVVQRLLYNEALRTLYRVTTANVLQNRDTRMAFVNRVFASPIETTDGSMDAFDWIVSQLCDGTGQVAPRELILFLSFARQAEMTRLEVGLTDLPGDILFDIGALDLAATEVSKFRLERTLFAEYPHLKRWIELLRGGDSRYSLDGLAQVWETSIEEARLLAAQLTDLGFFCVDRGVYLVPPLYQRTLNLIRRAVELRSVRVEPASG